MVAPKSGETFTPKYVSGPGGVKVAAGDMQTVCNQIAGTRLANHVLKNELKRAGWKPDRGKRDGKQRRFYTNNAKKSDWADDFVVKVGETDALF